MSFSLRSRGAHAIEPNGVVASQSLKFSRRPHQPQQRPQPQPLADAASPMAGSRWFIKNVSSISSPSCPDSSLHIRRKACILSSDDASRSTS
ncbi:uncharacterized protein PAC_19137 [Phialocephala subalpina]|uniref:Uncharacterized protein n=1 Tax=Phialocephala subalpina TaxID=576137 RepID=A0A1L7XW45_9HELO|nr:uncharacterized protein PAC_19137 [Phialocephala subalpina]